MKAILTTALSLAFVLAFTLPVDAKQAGSAGGSGNNYSCDSETGLCHCQGYFDCRNMEDKVCRSLKDGGHFACSVGKSNCNCEWKQKTLGGGRPSTTDPAGWPRPIRWCVIIANRLFAIIEMSQRFAITGPADAVRGDGIIDHLPYVRVGSI